MRTNHVLTLEDLFLDKELTLSPQDLLQKIHHAYSTHLKRLADLDVESMADTLPPTLRTIAQISVKQLSFFLPLYQAFLSDYLDAFQNQKLKDLLSEGEWLCEGVPKLMFYPKPGNIVENFNRWITNAENFSLEYQHHYAEDKGSFEDMMWNYGDFFTYVADYLITPFDATKIESILNTIDSPVSDENLTKALIQEYMLGFIKNHLYLEGFIHPSRFYRLDGEYVERFCSQKLTRDLENALFKHLYESCGSMDAMAKMERMGELKEKCALAVLRFYRDLMRSNLIDYLGFNGAMESSLSIKHLLLQSIQKHFSLLRNSDKEDLGIAIESITADTDIAGLLECFEKVFNHQGESFIYTFNSDDLFAVQLSRLAIFFKEHDKGFLAPRGS